MFPRNYENWPEEQREAPAGLLKPSAAASENGRDNPSSRQAAQGTRLGPLQPSNRCVNLHHEHPRPSLFESDFEQIQPRKWPVFTPPRATGLWRRLVAYYCYAAYTYGFSSRFEGKPGTNKRPAGFLLYLDQVCLTLKHFLGRPFPLRALLQRAVPAFQRIVDGGQRNIHMHRRRGGQDLP